MMKRQAKNRVGATPGKIALIAILGVILIGVLASNFRSADEPAMAAAEPASDAAATALPGAAAPQPRNPSPFGDFADDESWIRPPVDEVIGFDPLHDGSTTDVPPAPEYNAAELDELRNAPDAIIFQSGGQTVARIGSKDIHVGDVVGGLEVREISSAGIVLSEPK